MSNNHNDDNFDFLNFDINNTLFNGSNQLVTPDSVQSHQQQLHHQFDHPFLDDLDTFGLTPGINIIEEEGEEGSVTPLQFDQSNFNDLNQELPGNTSNKTNLLHSQQQQQQLAPNSYQSTNYATSYNNLSFNNNNNNNNLTNLISPNDFSDFDNSPYGSSFQHGGDSLKSPPPLAMNSPTFSPSSLSSSAKNLSKEEKLRRRREFHNAVERRRRDLIKDRIKELGQLIPPSLLFEVQFNKEGKEVTKESRANKSIILNKTVEYILNLQNILSSQDERLAYLKKTIDELGG